ncbi:hypothetical protein IV38_GL000870 [Lactobacillus selangorensis]|uniref:Uncharacterized protein n=1 Tax=Lactobacillus selangorensis TaxID=81857 RepID=A0A0R2FZN8_9LACO|nr:hypothetical protein [Lactobacillus selangorensis]KRN28667.1 hypothetical protein IV38_GL000870 [Lactobacillus selangorensis]KRN32923.1 hypothetical protein IV40_GL000983 [Lactobacillus selangorensis]
MADYAKKEDQTLDDIAKILSNFDDSIAKANTDDAEGHKTRGWFETEKAVWEIKRALHDAGKYDDYSEDEYDKFLKDYNKFIGND